MKVEIYYEAPDTQVLELSEGQDELWIDYSSKLERAREIRVATGWSEEATKAYNEADRAYETFLDSINLDLEHPDLEVDEVIEW
ncbi:MAG TPA: hypothetical protein VIY48_09180 [Candidatus Paceibacterota bacterium]